MKKAVASVMPAGLVSVKTACPEPVEGSAGLKVKKLAGEETRPLLFLFSTQLPDQFVHPLVINQDENRLEKGSRVVLL